MKIRTCFVSNSSSSSFLIVGNPIEPRNVRKVLEDRGEVLVRMVGCGTSGDCEDWIARLTSLRMYDRLVFHNWYLEREDRAEFYTVDGSCQGNGMLKVDDMVLTYLLYCREDHSSPADSAAFYEFLDDYETR